MKLTTFTAAEKTSFSVTGLAFDSSARQSVQQRGSRVIGCTLFTNATKPEVFPSIPGAPFCTEYQNFLSVEVFLGKEMILTALEVSKRGSQNRNSYKN